MDMLKKIKTIEINQNIIKFSLSEDMSKLDFFKLFNISKPRQKHFKLDTNNLLKDTQYTIECEIPSKESEISEKEINVVYEDDICLIVFKPCDLLVHNDGNTSDTLSSRVNFYSLCENHLFNALPIHRIDKDTSGLVFFCKHPFFQGFFDSQIEKHIINKEYIAIIQGNPNFKHKHIDKPISRDRHNAKKMIVHKNGKPSISDVEKIKIINNQTLVKVKIETGRKHQIRTHLSCIGYPIVNDELYGSVVDDRKLLLQSYKLTFIHPLTKKSTEVISSMDNRFKPFLDIPLTDTTY